jgi:hypothetical protein
MAKTKRLRASQLSQLDNTKKDKERSVDASTKLLQAIIIGMCLSVPALLATNYAAFAATILITGCLTIFLSKGYRNQVALFNKANASHIRVLNS